MVASGGMDSSTIAAMAASIVKPETLHVYHVTYHFEETRYAQALAERFDNIQLHVVQLDGDEFPQATELVYQQCAPEYHPQAGPPFYSKVQMFNRIAKDGFKTVLTGEGGDEIFLGYPLFHFIPFKRNLATLRLLLHNINAVRFYPWRTLREYRRRTLSPKRGTPFLEQFYDNRAIYKPEFICSLFQPQIQEQLNVKDVEDGFFETIPIGDHSLDMLQKWFLTQDLPCAIETNDATAKVTGLTVYSPMMNPRIIEHVLSLPPKVRAPPPHLKILLRKIAEPYLPPKILNRKDKKGFPTPFYEWMTASKIDYIRKLLLSDDSKLISILDPKAVMNILARFEEGEKELGFLLYELTQLEYWLKAINVSKTRG